MIEVIRKDGKVGQVILQNDMLIYRPEKGINMGVCCQSLEELSKRIYKIGYKIIGKGKDWKVFCLRLIEEDLLLSSGSGNALDKIPDELYIRINR